MIIKTSSDKSKVVSCVPDKVSPCLYNNGQKIVNNQNNFKFANSPRFIFGTSKRSIDNKIYYFLGNYYIIYSSFGEQIMTQKNSRPLYSFS